MKKKGYKSTVKGYKYRNLVNLVHYPTKFKREWGFVGINIKYSKLMAEHAKKNV